jgi:hypothetical protein
MGLFDKIGNFASNNLIDPMRSMARGTKNAVTGAWDVASGASATKDALGQQMAGANQAQGAMTDAYNQSRGILNPYMQGGAQDYQNLRAGVQSGAYNSPMQAYQGPMSSGVQGPQFQGYQGPMGSAGQFNPQLSSYQGPMASGNQFTPQYREYQGQMASGNQAPQFQGYQGPMSSGSQLPQMQQFQGPSQYQADARPERQAGTSANVNMYADPGYQFRLDQGLGALENRMAGRGLVGSGAEQKGIMDYAQGLASQEFGAAYGRQQQDQMNRQNDFESDRGFGMTNFNQNFQNAYGMNQDANAWNAQNADRGQARFEGDRAAGMQQNQFANSFGMQGAQFNQGVFEGDRAAGMQSAQGLNDYMMNRANFQQGAFEGDRAAGMQNTQMNNANATTLANFQQGAFEGDRSAGMANNQFQNNYGMNLAQFQQGAFEGDRAAGMQQNQFANNYGMQNTQNQYNMQNGLAGMGYNAAGASANLATGYGQNLADLYQNMGNMQGLATMTQSSQRRGLFGDAINLGTRILG